MRALRDEAIIPQLISHDAQFPPNIFPPNIFWSVALYLLDILECLRYLAYEYCLELSLYTPMTLQAKQIRSR